MMDIFINKNVWEHFSKSQLKNFKQAVFDHYREYGFPYYPTDYKSKIVAYNRLRNTNINNICENRKIKQYMAGLNLAWSYFPHSFDVKCNGLLSPKEVFENDDLFRKVIAKRLKRGDNMSDSGIRKTLRVFTGAQGVSNFRPTVAEYLYNLYADNGVVWDMSCGFGGRLLGFMVSNARKYIGTEPCSKTYDGLITLKEDYYNVFSKQGIISLFDEDVDKEIEIIKSGSEDFVPEPESLDFCFTSPPYFDTEKYSDEGTQSFKKFPTKKDWADGFLRKTFENCYKGLKKNKIMAINIADVKSFPDLEKETVKIAQAVGFIHEETLYYLLSSLSHYDKFKEEPIFIFRKM